MNAVIFEYVVAYIVVFGVLFALAFLAAKLFPSWKQLALTIYVLILILVARIGINIWDCLLTGNGLDITENILDGIVHALQTFSLDEDYTAYTVLGKELFLNAGLPVFSRVYGTLISFLNVCAPVLGGALILEILANIFPRLKTAFKRRCDKFVFSELNEASVTLAEDLMTDCRYKDCYPEGLLSKSSPFKPLIIFTDAYKNEASEKTSELFDRAKKAGAVCIRADLLHLPLRASRSVTYLLMDSDPSENLASLGRLLEKDHKGRLLWPCSSLKAPAAGSGKKAKKRKKTEPAARIFVFTDDPKSSAMAGCILKDHPGTKDLATVRVLFDLRNTAFNLMNDIPLFLPLTGRSEEEKKELCVAIAGEDKLALEVFKAAFWCGQLKNISLKLTLISKDAAETKRILSGEAPELLESCREGSELLMTGPKEASPKNPPYACVCFLDSDHPEDPFEYPEDVLSRTDYFVICLKDDAQNINAALKLKSLLGQRILSGEGKSSVIAAAVNDPQLSGALKAKEGADGGYIFEKDTAPSCKIIPFASLKERFSCENVFMSSFALDSLSSHNAYSKNRSEKFFTDEYNYWSSIARTVHAPYKAFDLGLITCIDLSKKGNERFRMEGLPYFPDEDQADLLAWVEHRRWNAYMRTEGFKAFTARQYESFYKSFHMHKSLDLKLHNCLVESGLIPHRLPDESEAISVTLSGLAEKGYDFLDLASVAAFKNDKAAGKYEEGSYPASCDYKRWDFLTDTYDPGQINDAALAALLGINKEN